MKNKGLFLLAIFSILVLSISLTSAVWTSNLDDQLVTYYNFNSTSDLSGYGNDIVLFGNATINNPDGIINASFDSDGEIGSYAKFSNASEMQINSSIGFTINTWYKTPTTTVGGYRIMWFLGNNGNYARMLVLNDKPYLSVNNCVGTTDLDCGANCDATNDNQWHQLSVVFNSTGSSIWQDGTYRISSDGTCQIKNLSDTFIADESDLGDRRYNVSLDEFGIWDRALNSTEISDLYNAGAGLTIPINESEAPPEVNVTSTSGCSGITDPLNLETCEQAKSGVVILDVLGTSLVSIIWRVSIFLILAFAIIFIISVVFNVKLYKISN